MAPGGDWAGFHKHTLAFVDPVMARTLVCWGASLYFTAAHWLLDLQGGGEAEGGELPKC